MADTLSCPFQRSGELEHPEGCPPLIDKLHESPLRSIPITADFQRTAEPPPGPLQNQADRCPRHPPSADLRLRGAENTSASQCSCVETTSKFEGANARRSAGFRVRLLLACSTLVEIGRAYV